MQLLIFIPAWMQSGCEEHEQPELFPYCSLVTVVRVGGAKAKHAIKSKHQSMIEPKLC